MIYSRAAPLALTTGDIGSVNARLRGHKWRMIHPPTHLHYFSAETMKALLDRHGFRQSSISVIPVSRENFVQFYITFWCGEREKPSFTMH